MRSSRRFLAVKSEMGELRRGRGELHSDQLALRIVINGDPRNRVVCPGDLLLAHLNIEFIFLRIVERDIGAIFRCGNIGSAQWTLSAYPFYRLIKPLLEVFKKCGRLFARVHQIFSPRNTSARTAFASAAITLFSSELMSSTLFLP